MIKKIVKKLILKLDDTLFRQIVKWLYPQYKRPRYGYTLNINILLRYAFAQKILRINGGIPWPVHFTSQVNGYKNITKGILCDPGDNIGIYINASGGLTIGNNVAIAANTTITTTNHDMYDHRKQSKIKGVTIGNNVWIGANCSIVAGVEIGDNVTIGSGCSIRKSISANSIVVSNEDTLRIIKKRPYKWDVLQEELN
jgi:acetyltransferase-like isoleucine patch superfamily enzyme